MRAPVSEQVRAAEQLVMRRPGAVRVESVPAQGRAAESQALREAV